MSDRLNAQRADLLHWTWSCRVQLQRYVEAFNSEFRRAVAEPDPSRAFSLTSFEEHLLLVALRNLVAAADRASRRLPELGIDRQTRDTVVSLRDAYEHWPTERPAFARGVHRNRGAVTELRKVNPAARPWIAGRGHEGITLGGAVSLWEVSRALEQFEADLLGFGDRPQVS